jgi:copper(I)-binding protein
MPLTRPLLRRSLLRTGLALSASLALPTARACEFFAPNLRIIHPWTRATAPGVTVATVCMSFDDVTRADRLIAVSTPVATTAEMGGVGAAAQVSFRIPAGQSSALSETGTFLRLVGLLHPLELGRSYPLTLVFERGGTVQADFDVDYAA